jgi:hypothetical protein
MWGVLLTKCELQACSDYTVSGQKDANDARPVIGSEGKSAILPGVLPSSVTERLDRLAPDQRAAATAPPGPVLCVAPAGSGKTTTLVARIAWLVATGADPARITAVTFNKRAADEMAARVDVALEPLGLAPGSVHVKTFHALGREILADGGERVEPLLDRESVLRDMWPEIDRGAIRRLDDAFSRLKLDIGVTAEQVGEDPEPGPIARAFLSYEGAIADAGAPAARGETAAAATLAGHVHALAGGRNAGRRSLAAPAGAAPRRPGEPDLPRRRRRPDDLRLEARRRTQSLGAGRLAARPAADGPYRQLPLSAACR